MIARFRAVSTFLLLLELEIVKTCDGERGLVSIGMTLGLFSVMGVGKSELVFVAEYGRCESLTTEFGCN